MKLLSAVMAAMVLVPAAAAAEDQPIKEKMICKRVTQADTGSHFSNSRRVCMTEAEWKEQEDATQRLLRDSRTRSSTSAGIGGSVGGGPQ